MIDSLINSEKVETEDLNKKDDYVKKSEDAATSIKECEETICTRKKYIISILYHQGKVFRRFKEKEKFVKLVKEFKVQKTTMIFKLMSEVNEVISSNIRFF